MCCIFSRQIRFCVITFLFVVCQTTGLFAQTSDSALFRDDFNRLFLGNFWQAGESWSILNGSAFNFIGGTGGSLRTTTGFSQKSYIIETRAQGFTKNYRREFRITFGQSDLATEQLYQIRYTAYQGGRLTLSKSTDNIYNPEVLDEIAIYPNFSALQWYTFKIAKYQSGLLQVYVDSGSGYSSLPLLEAIDSTYPALGHPGWQVDTESFPEAFYVNWISASKPALEKPAIREKLPGDDLLTQVSVRNNKPYKVAKLVPGVIQFIDRDYTIKSVPDYLLGASFIQTANDDKSDTSQSFLTFFAKRPVLIYIGYDPRATEIPEWLKKWTKTSDRIEVSDSKTRYLDVYSKAVDLGEVYPYPVILGGNLEGEATGSKTNYLVAAIVPPTIDPLQAENALLSGAVVSNYHQYYNGTGYADFQHLTKDFVEWSVKIDVPGYYNASFRFSNGDLNERPLLLTDNGIKYGTLGFFPTFTWDSWTYLKGPDMYLSSGTHKIRITSIGSNGPNIDELNLYFNSPNMQPLTAVSSARNVMISAASSTSGDLPVKAYPNPFLQTTSIFYDVKEKANVIVSIYTIRGQKIRVLQNGLREPGRYQANFSAGNLSNGSYIYSVQIGNELKTGKLLKE